VRQTPEPIPQLQQLAPAYMFTGYLESSPWGIVLAERSVLLVDNQAGPDASTGERMSAAVCSPGFNYADGGHAAHLRT
jgi:hypothetical protein